MTGDTVNERDARPGECRVELEVALGAKSLAGGILINGWRVPNVSNVTVHYPAKDIRRVTIEIIPTDVVEVEEPPRPALVGQAVLDALDRQAERRASRG